MKTKIIFGDITTAKTDVIVNSANKSLRKGSGVSGAIHNAAGKELEEECLKYGQLDVGDAIITNGYNLNAKYVIHTVVPKWYLFEDNRNEMLYFCYYKSIIIADQNKVKSIAFPCLGIGHYKWPVELSAKIAATAIENAKEKVKNIDEVYIFCSSNDLLIQYKKEIQNEE